MATRRRADTSDGVAEKLRSQYIKCINRPSELFLGRFGYALLGEGSYP